MGSRVYFSVAVALWATRSRGVKQVSAALPIGKRLQQIYRAFTVFACHAVNCGSPQDSSPFVLCDLRHIEHLVAGLLRLVDEELCRTRTSRLWCSYRGWQTRCTGCAASQTAARTRGERPQFLHRER